MDKNSEIIKIEIIRILNENGKIRGKIYDGLKPIEVEQLKVDIGRLMKE